MSHGPSPTITQPPVQITTTDTAQIPSI